MGSNDFEGSNGGPLPRQKCPHCNGEGGQDCFIDRGIDISTHSLEWRECRTCDGTGTISSQRSALIDEGREMRAARVARFETLLEASRRMGISPSELSAIECGRQALTTEKSNGE